MGSFPSRGRQRLWALRSVACDSLTVLPPWGDPRAMRRSRAEIQIPRLPDACAQGVPGEAQSSSAIMWRSRVQFFGNAPR
jgi:hypothetical protein